MKRKGELREALVAEEIPTTKHSERAHAVLSPSSAKRWMTCPGSVALSARCPKPKSSIYADEGTHAHEIAEKILTRWIIDRLDILDAIEEHKKLFPNSEMEDCVVGYVLTAAQLLIGAKPKRVAIEKKFKLPWEPESHGTADFCFDEMQGKLHRGVILDYKHGKGVPVDAKDNPQLASYAVAMDLDPEWGPFDIIDVYIFQPRCEHEEGSIFRRMRLKREELDGWRGDLMDAARICKEEAAKPDPFVIAGDHCQFCPAEGVCKRRLEYLQGDPSLEFLPVPKEDIEPQTISDDVLARLVTHRADVEAFLKRVEEYVVNCFLAGTPIAGLKLVHGRSSRRWMDEKEKVAEGLICLGVPDPYTRDLIGITAAEKIVGKNRLNHLTVKPEPSLKVVDINDPRPAVDLASKIASQEFKEIEA